MAPDTPADERRSPSGPRTADPWAAFGYLVAGVAIYGLAGWGLDRWWGTSFMVGIGIVLGAVLGTYLSWARVRIRDEDRSPGRDDEQSTGRTSE